jgi:hypothetical protein
MNRLLTSIYIVFATAVVADAQTASEYLLLQRTASRHAEVTIAADDGAGVVRGRLVSASDAVLELETRTGRRRFELSNVLRVERTSDSTINGVLRGMAVAATWCVLMCQNESTGRTDAGAYVGRLALGGLIGGAIDRRVSRPTILYRRGPANGIAIGVGRQGVTVLF